MMLVLHALKGFDSSLLHHEEDFGQTVNDIGLVVMVVAGISNEWRRHGKILYDMINGQCQPATATDGSMQSRRQRRLMMTTKRTTR